MQRPHEAPPDDEDAGLVLSSEILAPPPDETDPDVPSSFDPVADTPPESPREEAAAPPPPPPPPSPVAHVAGSIVLPPLASPTVSTLEPLRQTLHTVTSILTALGWVPDRVLDGEGGAPPPPPPIPTPPPLPPPFELGGASPSPALDALRTQYTELRSEIIEARESIARLREALRSSADAADTLAEVDDTDGLGAPLRLSAVTPGTRSECLVLGSATCRGARWALGQWLEVLQEGAWREGSVLRIRGKWLYVACSGVDGDAAWVSATSPRLAPFRTNTPHLTLEYGAVPTPVSLSLTAPRTGTPPLPLPSAAGRQPAPHAHEATTTPPPEHVHRFPLPANSTTPHSVVSVTLHPDDPRTVLPGLTEGLGVVVALLRQLNELTVSHDTFDSQVAREVRRRALLAGASDADVYPREGDEAASVAARMEDFTSSYASRTVVSATAAVLAPLADRLGRALTDAAPWLQALAAAPALDPLNVSIEGRLGGGGLVPPPGDRWGSARAPPPLAVSLAPYLSGAVDGGWTRLVQSPLPPALVEQRTTALLRGVLAGPYIPVRRGGVSPPSSSVLGRPVDVPAVPERVPVGVPREIEGDACE